MKTLFTMMVAAFFGCPLFATTWYVNGTSGLDGYSGKNSDWAKKTIQAAIDAAVDGDVILVAPGTYAPIITYNKAVHVKAVGNAKETIIDAQFNGRCVSGFGTTDSANGLAPDQNGCAPNFDASNATTNTSIIGFCIQNGKVLNQIVNGQEVHGHGGCVSGGTYIRCVIKNGEVGEGGGGCHGAVAQNCLIVGNRAKNGGAAQACALYNCTIANNTCDDNGAALWDDSVAVNCVVYGNSPESRTIFGSPMMINVCLEDPIFVDAANGDYRLAANSPCIDAGDNSYVTSEVDLDGNARIVNGKVDIGCYEYGTEISLNNGLVAWYKFDGNANDSSGNGNNGVVQGATLTTDRFGDLNGAYAFDGVDDCIRVPSSVLLETATSVFGVSVWMKSDWGDCDVMPIINKDWQLACVLQKAHSGMSGQPEESDFFVGAGWFEDDFEFGCKVPVDGFWHHWAFVGDGINIKVYLDGSYKGSGSVGLVDRSDSDLYVGVVNLEGYLNGTLDDLRIYNRVLSAAEVKALYEYEGGSSAGGIQLWENGPYWATRNVGASDAEGEGWSFLFGDTRAYRRVGDTGDQWEETGSVVSAGATDPAEAYWGEGWRCPTGDEYRRLFTDCDFLWDVVNGVTGWRLQGRGSFRNNSIFIPLPPEDPMEDDWLRDYRTDSGDVAQILSEGAKCWSDDSRRIGPCLVHWWGFEGSPALLRAVRDTPLAHPSPEPAVHTVTFDAEGGTAGWTQGEVAEGAAVGALPTATRAGYEFLGWFTAAVGGTQVTAATVVTADVTFYAQWKALEYDISYLYLKGAENPNPTTYTIEDELTFQALSDVLGWRFVEWSLGGISLGSTGDKTVLARWTPVTYGITYTGVKGGVNSNPTSYTIEDAITFTALSDVTGYRFTGWSPRAITAGTTGDKTITANWTPIRYAITYVNTMGAANPNPTSYTIEDAVTFAALPDVEGWRFVGWSFAGISRGNTGDVTVSANWESTTPSVVPDVDDEEPMDAGVANTYDGIIMDADGLPVGYISIKAAKASGKGEVKTSKVTATIQMAGEAKKVTVKGNVNVSEATLVQHAPDGRVLDLIFTRNSIFGTFDDYEIEGVRNILASTAKGDKGSEAKQRAENVYNRLKGNYVMAYGDENGWNGLSVSIMTKGKVKVSGALADGTKVSTSTQMIVGEDYSCIPVIYTKKNVSLAFSIYFSNRGDESFVFGYYDAVISRVAALDGERVFCLDGDLYGLFDEAGYELVEDYLPWEVSVAPKGTKWIVADGVKAGQIKMDKDGEVYDAKESDNPSGLKLTFTAKTGLFKGSFKVYAIDVKGKLKSFSATVNGIVVDGLGYGTATIKKIGSVPVAIE